MIVDPNKFEKAYRQLLYVTDTKYSDPHPSFTTGFWDEEEGYKRDFWQEAREKLELESWDKFTPHEIVSKATQPFGVLMSGTYQKQNLVSKPNYDKLFEIFVLNEKESAAVLRDVFFGNDDSAAFRRMIKLLSKKSMNDPLSVISLFFFLKDKDRYVTARKGGTGDRLVRLGLSSACVQKCTWKGYQQYLSIIKDLYTLLLPYQPDATFLDAQSFLWMLHYIEKDTPEYRLQSKTRILFCNITWMDHYDHILFPDDQPRYGGSYVADTGSAFESWNFHRYDDGRYYGFVETKYTGETAVEENAKQLHIEKIEGSATGESIDGVTVVFCAHSDSENATVIIGWYKNATVLRRREKHLDGHAYNISAAEAVLLPGILRNRIVPRARKNDFGFGQSNVWFAREEAALQFVSDTLSYIEKFQTEEDIWDAAVDMVDEFSDEKLSQKAAAHNEEGAPVYTSTVTLRKRTPALVVLTKRRANGVCQLCGEKAPFKDKKGRPYLEAHHIVALADNGPDELSNMVALCPNCHRKMHVVKDEVDIQKLKSIAEGATIN